MPLSSVSSPSVAATISASMHLSAVIYDDLWASESKMMLDSENLDEWFEFMISFIWIPSDCHIDIDHSIYPDKKSNLQYIEVE